MYSFLVFFFPQNSLNVIFIQSYVPFMYLLKPFCCKLQFESILQRLCLFKCLKALLPSTYLHFARFPGRLARLGVTPVCETRVSPAEERAWIPERARAHTRPRRPQTHALSALVRWLAVFLTLVDRLARSDDVDPDPDDRRQRDADGGGSVAPHEDRVAARQDPRHLQREARAAETLLPRKTGRRSASCSHGNSLLAQQSRIRSQLIRIQPENFLPESCARITDAHP